MCFDHHDEYDGTTRIAKGLTEAEVKTWRYELYKEMELRLAQGGVAKKPKNRVFGLILKFSPTVTGSIHLNCELLGFHQIGTRLDLFVG